MGLSKSEHWKCYCFAISYYQLQYFNYLIGKVEKNISYTFSTVLHGLYAIFILEARLYFLQLSLGSGFSVTSLA